MRIKVSLQSTSRSLLLPRVILLATVTVTCFFGLSSFDACPHSFRTPQPSHLSHFAMSWDNARKHARALETALDLKLASYSRIAHRITRGPGQSSSSISADEDGAGGYKLVEEEVEELLSKVGTSYLGYLHLD